MQRTVFMAALLVVAGAHWHPPTAPGGAERIVVWDDCDSADTAWNATGGCTNTDGNVTQAEFGQENGSPLAASIVGHQGWRNDPSYLIVQEGESLQVENRGGRTHSFTRVAEFGGGVVPPLNQWLTQAPECPGLVPLPAGGQQVVAPLPAGNHRFQCCFHPWMRTLVKVKADN